MARWLLLAALLLPAAARADVARERPFDDDCGKRAAGCCVRLDREGNDAGFGACRTRPPTCEDVGVVGLRGPAQPDDGGCCLREPDGSCGRKLPPPVPYCDVAAPGADACQPARPSRFSCASAQAAGPWALALAVPLLLRRRSR